jgi:Tol biopolymer transport system component
VWSTSLLRFPRPRGQRRSLRGACVTTALAASIAPIAASTAHAAFPGDNGKIAFSAGLDCGYDGRAIASINPDGTGLTVLADCDDSTYAPNWSPDGRTLLFTTAFFRIWRIAADGSGRRRISFGWAPSFAPDGRHYAYQPRPQSKYIRRARLNGRGDRVLGVGQSPLWSPSGRTIAYFRKGIWIMNARTGKRVRRVASQDFMPLDWSPDGRRLLCFRYTRKSVGDDYDTDLFVVPANGRRSPRRLIRTPRRAEIHAAWSPNGRRVVFAARTAPAPSFWQVSIWSVRKDGTREKRIWQAPAFHVEDEDRAAGRHVSVTWQPLVN